MEIYPVSPADQRVQPMIRALDEYQEALYPAESNHLDGLDTLLQDNVHFIGAFDGNTLLGIGAVKHMGGYGEIKRMFIPERFRGQGIADGLMTALLDHLSENGICVARLETGSRQVAAIRFYEKAGFVTRPPFGDYREDPLSVFMEKSLP